MSPFVFPYPVVLNDDSKNGTQDWREGECNHWHWQLTGTSLAPHWHLTGTSLAPHWHLTGTSA